MHPRAATGAAPDGPAAQKHEVSETSGLQVQRNLRVFLVMDFTGWLALGWAPLSHPGCPLVTLQARIHELNNKLDRTRDTYAKLVAANEAYAKSARKVASAERRLQDQETTARKARVLARTGCHRVGRQQLGAK